MQTLFRLLVIMCAFSMCLMMILMALQMNSIFAQTQQWELLLTPRVVLQTKGIVIVTATMMMSMISPSMILNGWILMVMAMVIV